MTAGAQGSADELRQRERDRETLDLKIRLRVARLELLAARTWLALVKGSRLPASRE